MIFSATLNPKPSASIAVLCFVLGFCEWSAAQDPAPKQASPNAVQSEKQSIRLPSWVANTDWTPVVRPFEEAVEKGGKLMQQLPIAVVKEMAVARRGVQRAVAGQRIAVAAMPVGRAQADQQMEQQIKAMIPQYRNQYINVLHGELQAARNICDVPKEIRGEVYKATEEAYDKALEEFIRGMYFPTNRGRRGGMLRSSVRGSLVTILEAKLPAEEFAKLSVAVRERTELRKRVAIEYMVARLDEALRLTKEQRQKITQSLSDNWVDDWESWMMLWQYEDMYMPQIDDSLIATHLTPHQRRIWQQTQKISLQGEMNSEFAGEFDAAFWQVPPAKAKVEAEVIERLGPG